jgi:hypothetical protein
MISLLDQAPDLQADDYLVLGVATCFLRNEDGVQQVRIIEPIPASALEALFKGVPTSYSQAIAISISDALKAEIPAAFTADAELAEEFGNRSIAAARTFKRRPEAAAFIPMGTTYDRFIYSLERKRVLNPSRNVTKDDNVKQHAHTHAKL